MIGEAGFHHAEALPKRNIVRPEPILRDFLKRQLPKAKPIVFDAEPSDRAPKTAEGPRTVNRVQQFVALRLVGELRANTDHDSACLKGESIVRRGRLTAVFLRQVADAGSVKSPISKIPQDHVPQLIYPITQLLDSDAER